MIRRLPLIAAISAVLLLTACGPATPPTPTPTASGVAAPTPSATPTPSPSASAAGTLTAGDCTPAEEAATGLSYPIPVVYTVYNTLASDPLTIHYTAFNTDGTMPVETVTADGPVTNIVGYPCTNAEGDATWTLIATHSVPGSIGCVLDFGGLLVQTDSAGQEDPSATVTCTGNPGE